MGAAFGKRAPSIPAPAGHPAAGRAACEEPLKTPDWFERAEKALPARLRSLWGWPEECIITAWELFPQSGDEKPSTPAEVALLVWRKKLLASGHDPPRYHCYSCMAVPGQPAVCCVATFLAFSGKWGDGAKILQPQTQLVTVPEGTTVQPRQDGSTGELGAVSLVAPEGEGIVVDSFGSRQDGQTLHVRASLKSCPLDAGWPAPARVDRQDEMLEHHIITAPVGDKSEAMARLVDCMDKSMYVMHCRYPLATVATLEDLSKVEYLSRICYMLSDRTDANGTIHAFFLARVFALGNAGHPPNGTCGTPILHSKTQSMDHMYSCLVADAPVKCNNGAVGDMASHGNRDPDDPGGFYVENTRTGLDIVYLKLEDGFPDGAAAPGVGEQPQAGSRDAVPARLDAQPPPKLPAGPVPRGSLARADREAKLPAAPRDSPAGGIGEQPEARSKTTSPAQPDAAQPPTSRPLASPAGSAGSIVHLGRDHGIVSLGREVTVNPQEVRFIQNDISSKFRDGRDVCELARRLVHSPDYLAEVPRLQCFLEGGVWYSLDNRRLFALKAAGIESAVAEEVSVAGRALGWRRTTTSEGRVVVLRGDSSIARVDYMRVDMASCSGDACNCRHRVVKSSSPEAGMESGEMPAVDIVKALCRNALPIDPHFEKVFGLVMRGYVVPWPGGDEGFAGSTSTRRARRHGPKRR